MPGTSASKGSDSTTTRRQQTSTSTSTSNTQAQGSPPGPLPPMPQANASEAEWANWLTPLGERIRDSRIQGSEDPAVPAWQKALSDAAGIYARFLKDNPWKSSELDPSTFKWRYRACLSFTLLPDNLDVQFILGKLTEYLQGLTDAQWKGMPSNVRLDLLQLCPRCTEKRAATNGPQPIAVHGQGSSSAPNHFVSDMPAANASESAWAEYLIPLGKAIRDNKAERARTQEAAQREDALRQAAGRYAGFLGKNPWKPSDADLKNLDARYSACRSFALLPEHRDVQFILVQLTEYLRGLTSTQWLGINQEDRSRWLALCPRCAIQPESSIPALEIKWQE